MIGKIIDNYKIIQHIGTGGMGTVYLAEDMMLGRKIAIKMLHSELLFKKDILERFKTEAKTLAKLNHPNIAILFNLIESSGNYFMIMEYVNGNSLEKLLIENGAVEANKAIDFTIQALEGIEHAHHKKIIHRDLKPANLMLNQEGVIKVMDFGIARALGSARMTREGSVVGTLEYMAPEQIRGKEGDERSDIYAMGIVLYELLTGNVPYRSKSDYDLMTKKLTQKPPEIRSFWHEIPKSLEKVVMKAIKKDPDLRFQSAEQFKLALKECKTDFAPAISTKAGNKKNPLNPNLNLKRKKYINTGFFGAFSNTRSIVNSIALFILILAVGSGAYFLRQKRLSNKTVSDTEKTEVSNDFIVQNTDDLGTPNNDSKISNNDFKPSSKLDLSDFNNDNEKKKKDEKKKNTPKTKAKKENKTNSENKKGDNNKKKDDQKKEEKRSDSVKNNNSGSNTTKINNKEKTKDNSGDKTNNNRQETKNTPPKEKVKVKKQYKTINTYIRKNIPIVITLPKEISSENIAMEGRYIWLNVDSDYEKNSIAIIPRGAKVYCKVNEIQKGKGRKKGIIEIEALYIEAPDGTHIPLKEAVFRYVGKRGENVTFRRGQKFKVKTAAKTNFTIKY